MSEFLEFVGLMALVLVAVVTIFVIIGAFQSGDHDSTEIYSICKHGRVSIRAINSDGYSEDRTLQVFVDRERIARIKVDPEKWERLATAMREPYAGCKP